MSTALSRPITADAITTAERLAPIVHLSRLFGVASPEQAIMALLKAHELGIPMLSAGDLIHVIDGKLSLSPRGALALVLASGLLEHQEISESPGGAVVTMRRRGGLAYTCVWTIEDAKRAGLFKPGGGWDKYPANMCRWRAIGFVLDILFPDVTGGLKTADQFGAELTEAGDVITVSAAPACEHGTAEFGATACPSCGELLS